MSDIALTVKSQDGSEMQFKVRRMTRFRKMLVASVARKGLPKNGVKFLFDGQRLADDSTPEEMGMDDDDVIDAVVDQVGGAPSRPGDA